MHTEARIGVDLTGLKMEMREKSRTPCMHAGEISRGMANLKKYEDADLIVLTSFEDLEVYTRYKKDKPRLRQKFNVQEYVTESDKLWNILSNTAKGKDTRAAYRATR